ncbi:hypothetical protein F5Y04DRAFT_253657 [Hypomontagnella monticulosa]|nr:hypothetical protein F5Y04DRAFT_253657 [Hypomontagnella monticulosa]
MAPKVFHLFPLLPPEIRHEIYLQATPPRIVHVQQHSEDEDDFTELFNDLAPVQVKLPPSLVYFARNWCDQIWSYRDLCAQPRLEAYGFTSSKPIPHPWKPTHKTPEIPVHWLLDHPHVAYLLLRKTTIYSEAPIPALLHTCVESRTVLMNSGYQLAFGSRSHEPRTWFHYGHDVLYLSPITPWYSQDLLDNGPWGTGQFDVDSLQQVRNLALAGGCSTHEGDRNIMQSTLSLLPRLEKLYLVEWGKDEFDEFSQGIPVRGRRSSSPQKASTPYERELWRCMPIEEIDILFQVSEGYLYRSGHMVCAGGDGEALMRFRGLDGEYFQTVIDVIVKHIVENGDGGWTTEGETPNPKQIPSVEIVHICKESVAIRLFQDRQKFWEEYCLLKERYARRNQHRRTHPSSSVNPGPLYGTESVSNRPVSPTDLQWQDDWEAFDEAHNLQFSDIISWDEYRGFTMDNWVEWGKIVRPSQILTLGP